MQSIGPSLETLIIVDLPSGLVESRTGSSIQSSRFFPNESENLTIVTLEQIKTIEGHLPVVRKLAEIYRCIVASKKKGKNPLCKKNGRKNKMAAAAAAPNMVGRNNKAYVSATYSKRDDITALIISYYFSSLY